MELSLKKILCKQEIRKAEGSNFYSWQSNFEWFQIRSKGICQDEKFAPSASGPNNKEG